LIDSSTPLFFSRQIRLLTVQIGDEFCPAGNAQSLKDSKQMILDGVLTHAQQFGDLTVSHTFRNLRSHLMLPWALRETSCTTVG